ncbi:MAG: hypothetical protein DME92_08915 [Verrucomicrobia bacterium]|nr:MAG: hypothetical protein DME92_08915 [Verrucomicrobiota bacterium]
MGRAFLTGILAAIVAAGSTFADSPSVTAVLSNSETVVGETVELQIKVTGPGDAQPPEEISVDGLEIHATGQSRQFEIHNFATSSSVTYNYTILPLRAGRFTIASQTVRAGGKLLRTPELILNVADAPGRSSSARPSRGTQSQSVSAGDLLFAELIVPKKVAYVGEIVPVQIRMGFDPRVRPRLIEPPEITGQGFTAQKLQQSGQGSETINGRPYDVVTYKTAIAAARAGKFEIGPVKAKAQVIVPRRRSAPRSRSPFGFDLDDPFSDPFFSNPFAQMGERREVEIKSEPVQRMHSPRVFRWAIPSPLQVQSRAAAISTASMRQWLKTNGAGTNIRRRRSSNRTMRSVSVAQKLSRRCFRLTRKSKVCQCSHCRISIQRKSNM